MSEQAKSDALAKAEKMKKELKIADTGELQLNTMQDAEAFCRAMVASGTTPYRDWTEVFAVMQTARDLGLKPTQAFRGVYVVNKKPALEGHMALALIRSSGAAKYFNVQVSDGETPDHRSGICTFQRSDGGHGQCVSFSIAEAKRAGLWGKRGPWTTHPDDMLVWKAVSRAAKRYFSDVILGLEIADVARDYAPTRPAPTPPSTPDPLLAEVVPEDTDPTLVETPTIEIDEDPFGPAPDEPPPGALSTDPDDDLAAHGMKPDKNKDKGLFE